MESNKTKVAFDITVPNYNEDAPFHPSVHYPELPFNDVSSDYNFPYQSFRQLLLTLGLDKKHFGLANWNPLGDIITQGETVVIKPNFVLDFNSHGNNVFSVITHPSIIRAIVDYVYIALKGTGRIIIADAPEMDCCWENLMKVQRLTTVIDFYKRVFDYKIELFDLRDFELINNKEEALYANRKNLPGDPLGSLIVNLGKGSEFFGDDSDRYYGADFDRNETIRHHKGEIQEYSISKTILSADTIIFVPKMKIHKKVGVTLNLKGIVGINTNKNYLIHYKVGTPNSGGDQFPEQLNHYDKFALWVRRLIYDKLIAKKRFFGFFVNDFIRIIYKNFISKFKKISEFSNKTDSGNWYGNDSAWKMTCDLLKIICFCDKNGSIKQFNQRKIFCVIDGIVGGDRDGPLGPNEKPSGCLVIGENPIAVDMVTTRLMGLDYKKIKQFSILDNPNWDFSIKSPGDIQVIYKSLIANGDEFINTKNNKLLDYRPHIGWIGHIEI